MKFIPRLLPILLLTACVGPDGSMYPPGAGAPPPPPGPGPGGYYPPGPGPAPYLPPTPGVPPTSDYLPHLSAEYRNGYDIGARDRSYGYPRDYLRAYQRFGRGYESYFQEGYFDGFDGRSMRH